MLTFAKARQLAESWVRIVCGDGIELVQSSTVAKPYGWVFFYQSSAFLKNPDDISLALAGNAPFIIDRINGEVTVLGTAVPTVDYLQHFETCLPPERLLMKPEQPVWT